MARGWIAERIPKAQQTLWPLGDHHNGNATVVHIAGAKLAAHAQQFYNFSLHIKGQDSMCGGIFSSNLLHRRTGSKMMCPSLFPPLP
jgi:hypothetical protein